MPNPTPEQLKKLDDLIEEMGFSVETDNDGQIVLYTGLSFDEYGEIVGFVDDPEGRRAEEVQG